MVNNILSIINLILVVTALVIAIVALTNRNKNGYQEQFDPKDYCQSAKFADTGTCQSPFGSPAVDQIQQYGQNDFQCCWDGDKKDGCPTKGPCHRESGSGDQVVCEEDAEGEQTCIPGYYCAQGICTAANAQNYQLCKAPDEGGTDINNCYSSAPACQQYDPVCSKPKIPYIQSGDKVMLCMKGEQTGNKWYTFDDTYVGVGKTGQCTDRDWVVMTNCTDNTLGTGADDYNDIPITNDNTLTVYFADQLPSSPNPTNYDPPPCKGKVGITNVFYLASNNQTHWIGNMVGNAIHSENGLIWNCDYGWENGYGNGFTFTQKHQKHIEQYYVYDVEFYMSGSLVDGGNPIYGEGPDGACEFGNTAGSGQSTFVFRKVTDPTMWARGTKSCTNTP